MARGTWIVQAWVGQRKIQEEAPDDLTLKHAQSIAREWSRGFDGVVRVMPNVGNRRDYVEVWEDGKRVRKGTFARTTLVRNPTRKAQRRNPWGGWRVAIVQTRAPGFGKDAWIEQRGALTVRPEDTEADVKRKAAAQYGVKVSDVRLRFPMEENPRKPTRKAQAFIGRKIRRLAHEGMKAPRRVAAAYSLARRAGFKVPKRARKNPRQRKRGKSESAAWLQVEQDAIALLSHTELPPFVHRWAEGLRSLATEMRDQLLLGVHENPTLAVLGNPPAKVVGTLSHRLYELRYKHAEDGKDYRHPFGPGAAVKLLADGSVWITAKHALWKDH